MDILHGFHRDWQCLEQGLNHILWQDYRKIILFFIPLIAIPIRFSILERCFAHFTKNKRHLRVLLQSPQHLALKPSFLAKVKHILKLASLAKGMFAFKKVMEA